MRTFVQRIGTGALIQLSSILEGPMSEPDARPPHARSKANHLAAKAAYNARELDQCLSFYAAEHQLMSRPAPPGREHIRAFLEGTLAAWPDLRLEVAQVVAEDDWVMGRCVATATHTTAVMGVAPTGKQIVTAFWDLHRFDEAGLIVQTWNLMDSLALMQQLGLVPSGDAAANKAKDSRDCAVAYPGAGRGSLALGFVVLGLAALLRRRLSLHSARVGQDCDSSHM
jgi:MYXO-CTERM domain-containing protein